MVNVMVYRIFWNRVGNDLMNLATWRKEHTMKIIELQTLLGRLQDCYGRDIDALKVGKIFSYGF